MTNNTTFEVEVKFFVPELARLRERVVAAGGVQKKPRLYERNVRYDTANGRLLAQQHLLRLRQDDGARITFKGPTNVISEAKVREELEIDVSDFHVADSIIQRLGFSPVQIYEKYRETFMLNGVEIVLDELPYGNFAELEGEEATIKAVSALLELDWSQRIIDNYLSLMAQLKQRHRLPFDDLTFDNFAETAVSVQDILPQAK